MRIGVRHNLCLEPGPEYWHLGVLTAIQTGVIRKWAKAIVEAGFKALAVDPSQASHFFRNITSFMVGYFTVRPAVADGFVDWDWLRPRQACERASCVSHIRLDKPVVVMMNGHTSKGVIFEPD